MSSWTIEHISFLLEHRMPERIDLEFKDALPGSADDLAPWIAAMANSGGGAIVFGVEEDAQGRAFRPSELAIALEDSTRLAVEAARSIDEPVAVRCAEIQDEGAAEGFGYMVVEVDGSARAPHLVGGVAWGRVEHGVRRLRRSEIARLFARSEGFLDESGLAGLIRRPARIVADIQRLGQDRVLVFKNVGDRPAFSVRWSHLSSRGIVASPRDDPFPVDTMRPASTHAVCTSFPPAELPAKIEVSWRDEGNALQQTLLVVT
jgi:Schlafen, AlbA_2